MFRQSAWPHPRKKNMTFFFGRLCLEFLSFLDKQFFFAKNLELDRSPRLIIGHLRPQIKFLIWKTRDLQYFLAIQFGTFFSKKRFSFKFDLINFFKKYFCVLFCQFWSVFSDQFKNSRNNSGCLFCFWRHSI